MSATPAASGFMSAVGGFRRVVLLAIAALVIAAIAALAVLTVNGPIYQRIVLGKDLVADILPPPEYVIEAYLEATLALHGPSAEVPARAKRLKALRAEYDDRQAYWAHSSLPKALKDEITGPVNATAVAFWDHVETGLLPALARGDHEEAQARYDALAQDYAAHRAEVDRLVAQSNAFAASNERLALASIIGAVLLLSAGVLGAIVMTGRGAARIVSEVVDPLSGMTDAMQRLADGHLSIDIRHADRADELGAIARAMVRFRDQGRETERLRQSQEASETEALKARQVGEERRTEALRDMAQRVEHETRDAVDSVAQTTKVVIGKANGMAGIAEKVQDRSAAVAAAAHQTLAQTQSVASTANELDGAIQNIRAQVDQARGAAEDVTHSAAEADTAILRLTEAVDQIGKVTDLIADIARQTNLLALNASVEAARAGDSGKGFAVVAGEVRSLAQQTASATADIRELIGGVERSAGDTATAVGGIGGRVSVMQEASGAIASAVQQQAAATMAIARSIAETTAMAERMAHQIEEVSIEAQAAGAISREVDALAQQVGDHISTLSHTLVRVVRTSTEEVDRRVLPRFAVDLPVEVEHMGRTIAARIRNISEGGAMVAGLDLAAGALVLRIAGIGDLKAAVLSRHGDVTRVRFNPSADQAEKVARLVASASARLAA